MRPVTVALLSVALGAVACRSNYDHQGPIGVRNMWAADAIHKASLRQAILSQSTLYPYHFVHGGDDLNDLGWRDLEILAAHFVAHGGSLGVRRGDASVALYDARLEAVETALAATGVEPGRVRLSDRGPGGAGISSERMLEVLERSAQDLGGEETSTRGQAGADSTTTRSMQ